MNRKKLCINIIQVVILSLTISCSSNEESKEKNIIKKTTDTIAHDAVDKITKPIDKAKKVDQLSTDRTNDLKEAIE